MLAALAVVIGMGLMAGAIAIGLVKGFEQLGKRRGNKTYAERFNSDAERLHHLLHPDEDESRNGPNSG
jgi:hypothetical protein